MIARVRRTLSTKAAGDRGFTLIELLVVVIIIGILAGIAIPIFLNQKQKGYDASVKSDLKNYASTMETYFSDYNEYPDTLAEFQTLDAQVSKGNSFTFFVTATGAKAGYVIIGSNSNSNQNYYSSSYNGNAPASFGAPGDARPTALTADQTTVGGKNPAVAAASFTK